jgi:hypothetical protein
MLCSFLAGSFHSNGVNAGQNGGAAADPFAASTTLIPSMGAVHSVAHGKAHSTAAQPKLGPATAKAKDPFADLAVL